MTDKQMMAIILDAMALAWLNKEICVFATVDEYIDCVRQVKERFND
jgi:hypothetical protein